MNNIHILFINGREIYDNVQPLLRRILVKRG